MLHGIEQTRRRDKTLCDQEYINIRTGAMNGWIIFMEVHNIYVPKGITTV